MISKKKDIQHLSFDNRSGTIIPILTIAYYGMYPGSHVLAASVVSTVVCLVLAFPMALILREKQILASKVLWIFVFIFYVDEFLLRTMAWQALSREPGSDQFVLTSMGTKYRDRTPGAVSRYGIRLPSIYGASYL